MAKARSKVFGDLTKGDQKVLGRLGVTGPWSKTGASKEDKIATGEKGSEFFTPAEAKRKIAELTVPGTAYWNRKDPGHEDAVKEVADMQEMVHPEEG